jgi:hypothetical protein
MVLIVGWGGGNTQDLGEVAPTVCPNCHNSVFLHYIRSQKQFSVYFVPIAQYGGNAYLACPICKMALPIQGEQLGAVESMRASTQRFRRGVDSEGVYRVAVGRFWAALGVAPSGAQVLRPPPAIPPPAAVAPAPTGPSTGPSLPDQLTAIAKLHDDGLLTDDEFATAKQRLLGA